MDTQTGIEASNKLRRITTSDIDELAHFQPNKNRRYTQLQPGVLTGEYQEVNLGDVQIFIEDLSAGTLIEASPDKSFVPFAAVLSSTGDLNYCGRETEKDTILQATGGHWDANFKGSLSFAVAAFDLQSLMANVLQLTGHELPPAWLISKASLTDPIALNQYALGINKVTSLVRSTPKILKKQAVQRMLSEYILRLALNVMLATDQDDFEQKDQSSKIKGVKLVVEFLHNYANQAPTIMDLCKISGLSERNLQYGFREYFGMTPTSYLRIVRLNGVRRDLLATQPRTGIIVDTALNWGFVELGRFSGHYRKLFNELPSQTISNNVHM